MKTFLVRLKTGLTHDVVVNAEDESQAESLAIEMERSKYLDKYREVNVKGTDIIPIPEKPAAVTHVLLTTRFEAPNATTLSQLMDIVAKDTDCYLYSKDEFDGQLLSDLVSGMGVRVYFYSFPFNS